MALQWMPPPLWRRTSWRFASEEHTLIHWVWSSIQHQNRLFYSENLKDVNCAHRTLPDVTELHNEAIMVWTMALTEAQVATFNAMWHSNPTTGDGELHTPPQKTPPSEETLHRLHAQLGDLNDSELQQLVKDLSQEIAV